MKPNWKDAPPEATHLAQENSGKWYWFDEKPYSQFLLGWLISLECDRVFAGSDSYNPDWAQTLEERPKEI